MDLTRRTENETDSVADHALYMQAQGLNPHGTLNPSGPVFLDVDNLIDYMNVIFHFRDEDAPLSQPLDKNRPTRRVPRAAFRVDQAMMTRYMEMLENAAVADPGPFETVAIWPDSGPVGESNNRVQVRTRRPQPPTQSRSQPGTSD